MSPAHGCSILETGAPPRTTATQNNHGDQNASPVISK